MADAAGYTPLDEVDRAILQLLQRNARHTTAVEIAETIGVSDSTVRNRIEALEEENIIEGYAPWSITRTRASCSRCGSPVRPGSPTANDWRLTRYRSRAWSKSAK